MAQAEGSARRATAGSQASLYVGDLEVNVTETHLLQLFGGVGPVASVKVCRDIGSRMSLGYAYVNYVNAADAASALEALNYTTLNGKPMRIMYSNRDPSSRKNANANIFIKNLDKAIDNKALYDMFSVFGKILSSKIATDNYGQSKGHGFVQFDQEDAAQTAIEKLNGKLVNDKQVFVGPFLRKQDRERTINDTKFTNVFVKNLSETTTEDDLRMIFGEFGNITSTVVMREGNKSKRFGFVNFENVVAAARAVEVLNGKKFDEKVWYVGKALKKSERELELKERSEQSMKQVVDKHQQMNLYLKNLDDSIDDDRLKRLFSDFGTITSCKVMRDTKGISKGSGFVAFSTPQEASQAIGVMNGKIICGKPLYVAFAQRKEERKASLQVQLSQARPIGRTQVAPRMPVYPDAGPIPRQQVFYGQGPQGPPAFINSQREMVQSQFGYEQQPLPGMRPNAMPMQNYILPGILQSQQGQHPGAGRAVVGSMQQGQHPMPMHQHHQQSYPRGRPYRNPPGRNAPDAPTRRMLPGQHGAVGVPKREAAAPPPAVPIGALASALASATREQQKTMLGESLYPLVEKLEHDIAAKVTGMLLEMDQTEVLHLLESPDALKAKVMEAREVLRTADQQADAPIDEIGALILKDVIDT